MNLFGGTPDYSFMQQASIASYPQMPGMYGMGRYGTGLYNGATSFLGHPLRGGGAYNAMPMQQAYGGNFNTAPMSMYGGFNFSNMGAIGNGMFDPFQLQLGLMMGLLLGMNSGMFGPQQFPQDNFTGLVDPFYGFPPPPYYQQPGNAAPGNAAPGNAAPAPTPTPTPPAPPGTPVAPITEDLIKDPTIANMTQSNGLGGFSPVVGSLYGKDAFVIDVTGQEGSADGRLDRNDLIKYKDANGNWQIRRVGDDIYEIQSRTATVQASKDMNARMKDGSVTFQGDMSRQQYNPRYWQQAVGPDGQPYWQVRPGVNPSDAINDVFRNTGERGKYQIDCAASTNLALMKAKLDTMGAEDFNREFNGFAIRGWETYSVDRATGQWNFDINGGIDNLTGSRDNLTGKPENLKPGDLVYFTNPNVREGSSANQGENAIFLGFDASGQPLFFGNPIGIVAGTQNEYGILSEMQGGIDPHGLRVADRTPEGSYAPPRG
jgi:hypothetical protein